MYHTLGKKKTKVVVKRLNSAELKILAFLRCEHPYCRFVVPLKDIVRSSSGLCGVFPWRPSLQKLLLCDVEGGLPHSHLLQLAEDLLQALAFLHKHNIAHLDMKLDSLVYTGHRHLQVINFESALIFPSFDAEIDEWRGTEGWTAPEVDRRDGARKPYNPFKADRYSCGLVLSFFASRCRGEDVGLVYSAKQLMSTDPDERPLLLSLQGDRERMAGSAVV